MTGILGGKALRCTLLLATAALLCVPAWAASPAAGAISQATPQVSWTGGPLTPTAASTCGGPDNPQCDNYKLTIVPPSYSFNVEITLTLQPTDDYDLEVYAPDGKLIANSGNSAGQAEKVVLANPAAGVYTVSASPFAPVQGYAGSAKITQLPAPPAGSTETPPRYTNYTPPNGMGGAAGEPSIGVDRDTGKVMYIAGTETLRITFDDCSSPATAKWENVSAPWTSVTTFDPILYTDPKLGRTYVSQLLPSKMSLMGYTDDDGASWTTPFLVNDNPAGEDTEALQPNLGVAPNGTVAVAFYDRRLACPESGAEATAAGLQYDPGAPYGARDYCINAAIQFYRPTLVPIGHNIRQSAHTWDPQLQSPRPSCICSSTLPNTFIGDYFGVDSGGGWTYTTSVSTYDDGANPSNYQQQVVARITTPS